MTITKDKRIWTANGKAINSYELYAVWLASPAVQAKYPGARPSGVTVEMVREYLDDKEAGRGIFRPRQAN